MAEYIEREKVIKLLNDNIGKTAVEAAVNGHSEEYFDGWTDATSSAIMGTESITAADVRPERYAKLVVFPQFSHTKQRMKKYCKCSACGLKKEFHGDLYFCSRCGAKLDWKDGDNSG